MSLASGTGMISGLNYSEIISKLRSANSKPIQLAQAAQSKISQQSSTIDGIKKVLLDFKTKAEALSNSDGFLSLSAAPSDYSVLSASITGGSSAQGSYSVYVRQLAQAHRIASQGVATTDSTPIANGAGAFKFKVGSGKEVSIDVTSSMTLQQLRDKINAATDSKVNASIVSDGTPTKPYRLVLTAKESGQDNAIAITQNDTTLNMATSTIEEPVAATTNAFNGTVSASGNFTGKTGRNIVMQMTTAGDVGTAKYKVSLDGGLTWSADDAFTTSTSDVDVTGAKAEGVNVKFAAGASPVNFAVGDRFTIDAFVPELQKAQNSIVEVDGIQISRATNTLTDVIDGVTLTAKKVSADVQTVKVENSNTGVTSKIKDFANAYNALVDAVAKSTAWDKESKKGAALFGDSGVNAIVANLRQALTTPVSANKTYATLSAIGMTFDGSGHLNVDPTKISDALTKSLDEVKRIFIESANSSNAGIALSKSTEKTKVGDFNVAITTPARQAAITGGRVLEGTGLAADEALTITYNEAMISVTLSAGQKIDQIVNTLNTQFRDKGMAIQASSDGGKLKLNATAYGSKETLSVFSNRDAAAAGQLGLGTTLLKDTGVDVAGTINGATATGSGQILKGVAGTDSDGLELKITATLAGSGVLTLAHGVSLGAVQRVNSLNDDKTGFFATRKTSYDNRIKEYDKTIETLTTKLDAEEDRMRKQFTNLETKLAALQSQGDYLNKQLASLVG